MTFSWLLRGHNEAGALYSLGVLMTQTDLGDSSASAAFINLSPTSSTTVVLEKEIGSKIHVFSTKSLKVVLGFVFVLTFES